MIMHIFKEEGFIGFYKGMLPSLLLTLNPLIQFSIYEAMKNSLTDRSTGQISNSAIAVCGMVSKLITTIVNYPLISIKTLYQARDKEDTKMNMVQVIGDIVKNEGFLGLFKGIFVSKNY
jgi:adenine nucleotide transporter 17